MTEVKDDLEKRMDINLTPVNNNFNKEITVKNQLIVLSYPGEKGRTLVKSSKKDFRRILPSNIQTEIVYGNTKLSSLLNNLKDVTAFEEKHVVYLSVCATADCYAD